MTDTLNPQKKQHNPRIRHFGMVVVLILLLIVAFAASIIVSVTLFSRTTREYREEIITKATKLAAGQVDGDRIDQWLESGADEAYIETATTIRDDVRDVYVALTGDQCAITNIRVNRDA